MAGASSLGLRGGGSSWARALRARRASPPLPGTAEGSRGRPVQSRRDPEPTRSQPEPVHPMWSLDIRYENDNREKTRSFANKANPFLLVEGNLREVSCDWHRATPGIKLPFSLIFSFSVVNCHPFSFLFVAPFQDDHWVPLYPQAGGEEGLALSSMGLTVACTSLFKAEVWCYLKTFI